MNYDVQQLIAGDPANIIAGAWEDFILAGSMANVAESVLGGGGTAFALSTSAILASSPAGHGVVSGVSSATSGDGRKLNLTGHCFAIDSTLGPISFAARFQASSTNARFRIGLSTAAANATLQSANDYVILDFGSITKQIQYRANGGTAVGVNLPTSTYTANTWIDFLVNLYPQVKGSSSRIGFEVKSNALGFVVQGETPTIPHALPGLADAMNFALQFTNDTAAANTVLVDYLGASQQRRP